MRYLLLITIAVLAAVPGRGQATQIPCSLLGLSELTIEKSPVIMRQRLQVRQAQANRQIATSTFDYRLSARLAYDQNRFNLFEADPRQALAGPRLTTHNYGLSSALSRTFRSGLTASADLGYVRIADNYPLDAFNQEVGPYWADNQTTLTFSLTQPLLRGAGQRFAAAAERAATLEVTGSQYNVVYVSAIELRDMALSYWQYLDSYQRAAIYQENEARVRRLLEITQDLVDAEKKPASDMLQVQADLMDKERQTLLAQQQLYAARQNLGRVVGLSETESEAIGVPLDAFPTLEGSGYTDALALGQLIGLAYTHRADLQALGKSREALEAQLDQARNNLKPRLDLVGFSSYGGAVAGNGWENAYTSLGNFEGRNVQFGASLNYVFPVNNNLAQAGLLSSQAALADQQVLLDNQARNIEINVSVAFNNLRNSVGVLEKARKTLGFYEEVFQNEQVKFQNGLTTLLNLILFQERLTFAQLDYLSAQLQFAQAIIQLRHETGTLVPADPASVFVQDRRVFYALPDLD